MAEEGHAACDTDAGTVGMGGVTPYRLLIKIQNDPKRVINYGRPIEYCMGGRVRYLFK